MTPAAAFDTAARAILRARGERASGTAIARILGVAQQQYNRTIKAESATTSQVQSWLTAWHASPYPRIRLLWGPEGCEGVVGADEGERT